MVQLLRRTYSFTMAREPSFRATKSDSPKRMFPMMVLYLLSLAMDKCPLFRPQLWVLVVGLDKQRRFTDWKTKVMRRYAMQRHAMPHDGLNK